MKIPPSSVPLSDAGKKCYGPRRGPSRESKSGASCLAPHGRVLSLRPYCARAALGCFFTDSRMLDSFGRQR
jgi:hypothetical protein